MKWGIKMTRKVMINLLLIILTASMLITGCSSAEDVNGGSNAGSENEIASTGENESATLPPMTDEEITLTFGTWLTHEMNVFLADKFMEKYPNITVEIVQATDDLGWNDFLTNLASNGELPDVFWYNGNLDVAIRNMWLGDFTDLFEADPENERLLDTLYDVGYFDGDRKLGLYNI